MDYLIQNNVHFSQMLWKFACEKKISFIYASSAATYGGGEHGYRDDVSTIKLLKPLNPYGYSKQLFDEWVLSQIEHSKPTPRLFFGLKFFNVFGPNEHHKGDMASVVYQAYLQIKDAGKIKLFKSHKKGIKHGMQQRDFIYVKDVCAIIDNLRLHVDSIQSMQSGIYNVGSGQANSFLTVTRLVFHALHKRRRIQWINTPKQLRDKYQYFTQANMDRTNRLMKSISAHFNTEIKFFTLEDAINDYISYLTSDEPYLKP